MEIEWDEANKTGADFELRCFDFPYAVGAFLDPHRIVAQDRRNHCRENRYRSLGTVDGQGPMYWPYTVRGSAVRIISARKVSRREVADYEHNARQDRPQRSVHLARRANRPRLSERHHVSGGRSAGREDEVEAMQDIAWIAHQVRRRLGLFPD